MKITDILFEEILDKETFLWEMSNLTKDMTGLPVNIFISTKISVKDRHGPRIKAMTSHADKIIPNEFTPISISRLPIDFLGNLNPDDFSYVVKFIQSNYENLIRFWNNEINIAEFLAAMKKV